VLDSPAPVRDDESDDEITVEAVLVIIEHRARVRSRASPSIG
jgi:hypothetical protein